MTLRLTVAALSGRFEETWAEAYSDIGDAGLLAITEAAEVVKREGRADIARAGFGTRWQNAFRVNVYPNKKIDASALAYHKIRYAGVFEEGSTIRTAKPMWVPLRSTPKKLSTRRLTAALFTKEIGPLFPVKGSKPPLLLGKVALNGPSDRSITLNKIRQAYGQSIFRKNSTRRLAGGRAAREGFIIKDVPLFFGTTSVQQPDKFSIREIVARASSRLAELYVKNFKGE